MRRTARTPLEPSRRRRAKPQAPIAGPLLAVALAVASIAAVLVSTPAAADASVGDQGTAQVRNNLKSLAVFDTTDDGQLLSATVTPFARGAVRIEYKIDPEGNTNGVGVSLADGGVGWITKWSGITAAGEGWALAFDDGSGGQLGDGVEVCFDLHASHRGSIEEPTIGAKLTQTSVCGRTGATDSPCDGEGPIPEIWDIVGTDVGLSGAWLCDSSYRYGPGSPNEAIRTIVGETVDQIIPREVWDGFMPEDRIANTIMTRIQYCVSDKMFIGDDLRFCVAAGIRDLMKEAGFQLGVEDNSIADIVVNCMAGAVSSLIADHGREVPGWLTDLGVSPRRVLMAKAILKGCLRITWWDQAWNDYPQNYSEWQQNLFTAALWGAFANGWTLNPGVMATGALINVIITIYSQPHWPDHPDDVKFWIEHASLIQGEHDQAHMPALRKMNAVIKRVQETVDCRDCRAGLLTESDVDDLVEAWLSKQSAAAVYWGRSIPAIGMPISTSRAVEFTNETGVLLTERTIDDYLRWILSEFLMDDLHDRHEPPTNFTVQWTGDDNLQLEWNVDVLPGTSVEAELASRTGQDNGVRLMPTITRATSSGTAGSQVSTVIVPQANWPRMPNGEFCLQVRHLGATSTQTDSAYSNEDCTTTVAPIPPPTCVPDPAPSVTAGTFTVYANTCVRHPVVVRVGSADPSAQPFPTTDQVGWLANYTQVAADCVVANGGIPPTEHGNPGIQDPRWVHVTAGGVEGYVWWNLVFGDTEALPTCGDTSPTDPGGSPGPGTEPTPIPPSEPGDVNIRLGHVFHSRGIEAIPGGDMDNTWDSDGHFEDHIEVPLTKSSASDCTEVGNTPCERIDISFTAQAGVRQIELAYSPQRPTSNDGCSRPNETRVIATDPLSTSEFIEENGVWKWRFHIFEAENGCEWRFMLTPIDADGYRGATKGVNLRAVEGGGGVARVQAQVSPDKQSWGSSIQVTDGEEYWLRVRLLDGNDVVVPYQGTMNMNLTQHPAGGEGGPWAASGIVVTNPANSGSSWATGTPGTYALEQLPKGSYTFSVQPPPSVVGGAAWSNNVTVELMEPEPATPPVASVDVIYLDDGEQKRLTVAEGGQVVVADAGERFVLDGQRSTNTDSFSWTMTHRASGEVQRSSAASWTPAFDRPGPYSIVLELTGLEGGGDRFEFTAVAVTEPQNQPPLAVLSTTDGATIYEADRIGAGSPAASVRFSGVGSTDPDGRLVRWKLTADYPLATDMESTGAPSADMAGLIIPVGTHRVTFTVYDDEGATDTVTLDITVTAPGNVPPVAVLATVDGRTAYETTTTSNGESVVQVAVTGAGSSDSGVGSIASYSLRWEREGYSPISLSGTGAPGVLSAQWFGVGTHRYILTVIDDQGASDSATVEFTVTEPAPEPEPPAPEPEPPAPEPPPAENLPPVISIPNVRASAVDEDGDGWEVVTMTATASDPEGRLGLVAWVRDEDGALLDDGPVGTAWFPVGTTAVTLKAYDQDDGYAEGSMTITVTAPDDEPVNAAGGASDVEIRHTAGNVDGYLIEDEERQWLNQSCRGRLASMGLPVVEVDWDAISSVPSGSRDSCDDLVDRYEPLFGGTGSAPGSNPTPSPGGDPIDSVQVFHTIGNTDGYLVEDGERQWVDERCRDRLVDLDVELRVTEWNDIAAIPSGSRESCDEIVDRLSGG